MINWFDTLVLDHSFALLHVMHINTVSDQIFGLRLNFESLVSAKDKAMGEKFVFFRFGG